MILAFICGGESGPVKLQTVSLKGFTSLLVKSRLQLTTASSCQGATYNDPHFARYFVLIAMLELNEQTGKHYTWALPLMPYSAAETVEQPL